MATKTVGNTTGQPQDYTVATNAGAADNDTQRIIHASDDLGVVSLAVMDDWDESDRAKVNPIAGQAGIQGGAGAVTALTVRVALATDANSVVPRLDDNGITVTPTIDTAVYASGDRLGSIMTFSPAADANAGSGTIIRAILTDAAGSTFDIDLALFQVSPTLVNADNGAFALTAANLIAAVPLGLVNFSTANNYSAGTPRFAVGTSFGGPLAIPYICGASSTSIFGVLIARGAYDAAATSDLAVTLHVVHN